MIDPECIKELKRIKWEYELNPNNALLAMEYSNLLTLLMRQIYDRKTGGKAEFAAYMTLLKVLTDVYGQHPNNKMVAVNYLKKISYTPERLDDNTSKKMMEIYGRFSNDEYATNFCYMGLYFLIWAHVEQKDTFRAERDIKYFDTVHTHNPTNEELAGTYAVALMGVASIQDFFKGRKTISKLKKLAEQYPYNMKITGAYENTAKMFRAGNFFTLLDNKNKYDTPLNENRTNADNRKSSILQSIYELFADKFEGITDREMFDGGDDEYDDNYGSTDDYDSGDGDYDDYDD